ETRPESCCRFSPDAHMVVERGRKKPNLPPSVHSLPLGLNGKDGFGAEAEAWVGGAGRQTSVTTDKHSSVSKGEVVGGGQGREREETRGEAGNDAQGSFAKIKQWSEKHGRTEAYVSPGVSVCVCVCVCPWFPRQEGREWARQHSSRIWVLLFFFFHQSIA
uniref:Uncharacterized protein n=1 Tax=Monopterus albus TaxID=43700 RepID=A0A3Q3QHH0_MONAL